MRAVVIILILLINNSLIYSQIKNKIFYGFTSDSLLNNHLLEIKDESTIELKSFVRHMQKQFEMSFSYKVENQKINIFRNHTAKDSSILIQFGFNQFLKPINLDLDKNAMVDEINKSVYVIYEDFSKEIYNYCLIDGEEFRIRTRLPNSKGLISSKKIKRSRKLKRKLRSIEKQINDYEIKIYKGWDAFNKFGYKYVFGVYEVEKIK